jgi:hypothetical protein
MEILRFTDTILNRNIPMGEKSKVAIALADEVTGVIDEKNTISGIYYASRNARTGETITFRKYNELDRPEYIARVADGSLRAVPQVLVPEDFPPRNFEQITI